MTIKEILEEKRATSKAYMHHTKEALEEMGFNSVVCEKTARKTSVFHAELEGFHLFVHIKENGSYLQGLYGYDKESKDYTNRYITLNYSETVDNQVKTLCRAFVLQLVDSLIHQMRLTDLN